MNINDNRGESNQIKCKKNEIKSLKNDDDVKSIDTYQQINVFTLYLCNHNNGPSLNTIQKILYNDVYYILHERFSKDALLHIKQTINKNLHLYQNCTENEVFSIINALILIYIKEMIIKEYKIIADFELQKNLHINENEAIMKVFKKKLDKGYTINIVNYFKLAEVGDNFMCHFSHVYSLFEKNLANETYLLKIIKEKETRRTAVIQINSMLCDNYKENLLDDQNLLVIDLGRKNILIEECMIDLIFLILYKKIKETNNEQINIYVNINEFVDVFDFFKAFVCQIKKFYEKIDYNVRQFYLFKYALNEKLYKIAKCKIVSDIKKYSRTKNKAITVVFIGAQYLSIEKEFTNLIINNFKDDALKKEAIDILESCFVMVTTHLQKLFGELNS
ncbi:hypothetical protein BDAP_002176 [Binucleata daphniae]